MSKGVVDPNDPSGPKRSRLRVAAGQVARAISGLPSGARYRLLTFANEVTDWTPGGQKVGRRSQRALTSRLEDLKTTSGGTNLWGALETVLVGNGRGVLEPGDGVDEIFIVTDGIPSSGEITDIERIVKLVTEMNRYRKIRINAVFAGGGTDEEFLAKLAECTGGSLIGW